MVLLVLLETGLGGKFDATNIATDKICSVITPISMDHMNFLGSSIKKITAEKLGIFNECKHAIISKQKMIVREIVRLEAKKKKIKLFEEGVDWRITKKDFNKKIFKMNFSKIDYDFQFPSLKGEHQIENASTAAATAISINNKKINKKIINRGLLSASWAGRMQKLDKGNLSNILGSRFEIWLDGGHNIEASGMIKKEIQNWKKDKIFLVFGMMIGKDPIKFLKNIINNVSSIFLLPIHDHQFIPPYEIKNKIISQLNKNLDVFCALEIKEALTIIKNKNQSGKVLICGSLYLAGDILKEDGFKIS